MEHLSFSLPDDFIKSYSKKKVPWGFEAGGGNSLGEMTFVSKYARRKPNGNKERWYETCRRVIEGYYSILKDHCRQNRTPWNEFKAQRAAQDAFDRMFHFKWLPPGRGLWMMGTGFVHEQKNSAPLQNCSYISTDKLSNHSAAEATLPFTRLMEMSMLGVGVGFDTKGAGSLTLHTPGTDKTNAIVIEDSREGWYQSVGVLLESYFFKNRSQVEFDYSLIRPAGEPIKGFGGVAAGPSPLISLHNSIRKIFAGREGEQITSTDIVDICNLIGKCVVAGNVRRSALISLGNVDDEEFANIKNPEVFPERNGVAVDESGAAIKDSDGNYVWSEDGGWSFTSNNSVFAHFGMDYEALGGLIGDNGEPGLLYLDMCREYGRLVDPPNHRDYRVAGTNPCSFAGETLVQTVNGPRRIDSLAGESFWALVDGKAHLSPSGAWITGEDDIYTLRTTEGFIVNLTGNHKVMGADGEWCEAQRLKPGQKIKIHDHGSVPAFPGKGSWDDGYLIGAFIGDGGWENGGKVPVVKVWEKDTGSAGIASVISGAAEGLKRRSDWAGWRDHGRGYQVMSLSRDLVEDYDLFDTGHKFINQACELTSSDFHAGLLRGLFDADGHIEGWNTESEENKGVSVRLGQSNLETLTAAQRMLLRLGVKSRIYKAKDAGESLLPDGHGGNALYQTKESWRLVISSNDVTRFAARVGFSHSEKATKLQGAIEHYGFYSKPFVATFESLEFLRHDNVWDLTVSDVHAFDANGLYVSNSEQSLESYECCTLVETFPTHHDSVEDYMATLKHAYLYGKAVTLMSTHWPETNEVMQRNRRIGCSMTGVAQFVEARGWTELRTWMDKGYETVQRRDREYSEWLGVRESIKTTSIKPSGTVSILSGVTPGVHWPVASGFYVRRIRYAANDPLATALGEAGYPVEPDVMDPKHTVVVSFPTVGPEVRADREVSIWEKADLAVAAQAHWADNQVSVTITFREDEKSQIPALLQAKEGQLKSISLLPILESGGAYAQMPYEAISREDWEEMSANIGKIDPSALYGKNADDAVGEKFCSNDTCEIG